MVVVVKSLERRRQLPLVGRRNPEDVGYVVEGGNHQPPSGHLMRIYDVWALALRRSIGEK